VADIYKFSTCFNRERKSLLPLQRYGGEMSPTGELAAELEKGI
jgi:hypothetical protein